MLVTKMLDGWLALPIAWMAVTLYALTAFLGILSMLRYRWLAKRIATSKNTGNTAEADGLSLVVTWRGDAVTLRERLPRYLEQQYPLFEVILIGEERPDEAAEAYLKQTKLTHPNLTTCFVPASTLYISRHALAVVLGLRAAHHDWVTVTDIDYGPQSPLWLSCLAQQRRADTRFVAGITSFEPGTRWCQRKLSYLNISQQLTAFSWGKRHKCVLAPAANLLLDKRLLLEKDVLAEEAGMKEGLTTLLFNRLSSKRNTQLCLAPEAVLWQQCPATSQQCHTYRLFRHDLWVKLRQHTWLSLGSALSGLFTWGRTLLWGVCLTLLVQEPPQAPPIAVFASTWLLHMVARDLAFNGVLRALRITPLHFTLPIMLHMQPLWAATLRWSHARADKRQFRKRFI